MAMFPVRRCRRVAIVAPERPRLHADLAVAPRDWLRDCMYCPVDFRAHSAQNTAKCNRRGAAPVANEADVLKALEKVPGPGGVSLVASNAVSGINVAGPKA